MSEINNGVLDQYFAGPSNSSNLEQLTLKGLTMTVTLYVAVSRSEPTFADPWRPLAIDQGIISPERRMHKVMTRDICTPNGAKAGLGG